MTNAGNWTVLTNGDKLWTMEISSPNALSINLLYDKFWLPEGTSLFLYSKDKKQYMGGFTSINNKGDSINLKGFATGIIQGSNVILEYYQPAHISQTAIISICNVVHGYKPIVAPAILTRSFGGSGNCQVNINCPEGEDWQKVIDIEKEDDDDKRFAEDTKIPVMTGDLYNVAVGQIDFLDVNFLTGNKDHDEGSPWMILRNFAAGLIHISIYIASAILLVMLIIYGIQIVGHSFDNPEGEAEAKTRLEQFTTSIAMLIGSVVIMGLCIFGSDTFFKSLENRENAELPIRVNVETAGYSFSTTAAGYARYMAGIEDVDEWVEKGLYTLGFIVLAWVNLAVIIFMIVRMFALWILSMIGPIAAALHILNIEGMMSFRRWAGLYISLSLIQVLLSMIYTLILNYAI